MNHHSKIDSTKVLKPQLRFPLFREFWNYKRFEELYKLQVSNSFSRENLNYKDGEVLNIHYGDIHTKFPSHIIVDKIKIPLINPEVDLSRIREECYCREGDLIIADASEDYGDLGKSIEIINLGNKRMLAGLHTYLARPITQLVSKGFISYLMMSWKVRKQIMVLSNGTKVYGLPRKSLLETLLVIPSSEEQKKIASFLSSIDSKIEKLTRKKELLEEYKKGVMQKLFSGEIRFKDDDGNNYPDWEEKRLSNIGETFNGLNGKTKEDFGIGKPFIQYMQIFSSSKIDSSKFGLVDIKKNEKQEKAKYGDVFFTTSSETPTEVGFASVLLDEIDELYLNSFCFGFRPLSLKALLPQFSAYLFRSQKVRREIVKLAQGSTRYNMSKVQLMKVMVSLPSSKEQQKISSFLSKLDKKIDFISSQIDKTKEFKKGLLQQMFV